MYALHWFQWKLGFEIKNYSDIFQFLCVLPSLIQIMDGSLLKVGKGLKFAFC